MNNINCLFEIYNKLYHDDTEDFWHHIADYLFWYKTYDRILDFNFDHNVGDIHVNYFPGSMTNLCYNALDRPIMKGFGRSAAIIWYNEDLSDRRIMTYHDLGINVCKMANALTELGVTKGDRVAIYMPMILETVIAMLACSRIGAVHVTIFAGLSARALAQRLLGTDSKILVSAVGTTRHGKFVNLLDKCLEAIDIHKKKCSNFKVCIIKDNLNLKSIWLNRTDCYDWDLLLQHKHSWCEPIWLESDHPAFLSCTSGSTGQPKCLVHNVAGYMVWAYLQFKINFGSEHGDFHMAAADLAWSAGHMVNLYGPLTNCCSIVLLEGAANYPDTSKIWRTVAKQQVRSLYLPPTVIRTMIANEDVSFINYDIDCLQTFCLAGEVLSQSAWRFMYLHFETESRSVSNLYGQTEGGCSMITAHRHMPYEKFGSIGLPLPGVEPILIDQNENILRDHESGEGVLVFKWPWPGLASSLFRSHEHYKEKYFTQYPGYFSTGDVIRRDSDGYYWMVGRTDDMMKVSGYLLSTLSIENVILNIQGVQEVAVVQGDHAIKGQSINVFVSVSMKSSVNLMQDLIKQVELDIGVHAKPDNVYILKSLPKNRNGKIMRNFLKNVACNKFEFEDLSMLDDNFNIDELLSFK